VSTQKKLNVKFYPIHLFVILIVISSILLSACNPREWVKDLLADKRPNFLVIITDDQRYDTMQYMPNTQAKIFDQGVSFSHAYISTPLCCPSRVSILTGMYAHNTKVRNNDEKNNNRTIMEDMKANGYYTGLVGKYLNSWNGEGRPEYDFWVSYFRGESTYIDPDLNVNGVWREHIGYITDILGTYSMKFVEDAVGQRKPWILFYTPIAPHDPTTPDTKDLGLYPDLAPNRPPSFNEEDVSDKPTWLQQKEFLTDEEIDSIDTFRRNQILTLVSLDRAIGRMLDRLEEKGELDNTFIVFISDNGKFWGEHRITSKNSFYEEAIKVPFAIRYPPLITESYVDDRLVSNIDIAPTIYELAGIKAPKTVDGLSLVPLLSGSNEWRDSLLIEGWPPRGIFAAIHTGRYVYAETEGDRSEFYDLEMDPYELENLIDDPIHQERIADMAKELEVLREPEGVPTPIPEK
jgi:arylsulfatase A-like enzyme